MIELETEKWISFPPLLFDFDAYSVSSSFFHYLCLHSHYICLLIIVVVMIISFHVFMSKATVGVSRMMLRVLITSVSLIQSLYRKSVASSFLMTIVMMAWMTCRDCHDVVVASSLESTQTQAEACDSQREGWIARQTMQVHTPLVILREQIHPFIHAVVSWFFRLSWDNNNLFSRKKSDKQNTINQYFLGEDLSHWWSRWWWQREGVSSLECKTICVSGILCLCFLEENTVFSEKNNSLFETLLLQAWRLVWLLFALLIFHSSLFYQGNTHRNSQWRWWSIHFACKIIHASNFACGRFIFSSRTRWVRISRG